MQQLANSSQQTPKYLHKTIKSLPDLRGKTFAITGTTSGTGFECAKALATRGGRLILLNRKSERSEQAEYALREAVPEGIFKTFACDLQEFQSVREAAKKVLLHCGESGIDTLCCNAGVMALKDTATKDGYDIQMQTNMLSHFLLSSLLFPALETAAAKHGEARIVMHSSIARFGENLREIYFEKRGGQLGGNGSNMLLGGARWKRYHQSKLANAAFTFALRDRLLERKSKVKAILAHPGLSATNLHITSDRDGGMSRTVSRFMPVFSQSAGDGSLGIIKACAQRHAKSGDFFGPRGGIIAFKGDAVRLKPEPFLTDTRNLDLLWKGCEEATGSFFSPDIHPGTGC